MFCVEDGRRAIMDHRDKILPVMIAKVWTHCRLAGSFQFSQMPATPKGSPSPPGNRATLSGSIP
jgi:hypothetical protein